MKIAHILVLAALSVAGAAQATTDSEADKVLIDRAWQPIENDIEINLTTLTLKGDMVTYWQRTFAPKFKGYLYSKAVVSCASATMLPLTVMLPYGAYQDVSVKLFRPTPGTVPYSTMATLCEARELIIKKQQSQPKSNTSVPNPADREYGV
ncbi:hypothetical protein [Xanthomonas phage XPV2]|nr:hypothetical protein [Xanthomonas phage XPV2]